MITQSRLKELVEYQDGTFYAIQERPHVSVGDKLGFDENGYIALKIDGRRYKAHRLVFLYHFGYMPDMIDHINGNMSDNRLENLRACSMHENQGNRRLQKNNVSGYKGVCWKKNNNKWSVNIQDRGKRIHVGYFKDPVEAAKAYDAKAREIFGVFAKTNFEVQ